MTRILLVEDEPAIAAGVRDDLEFEGYLVDVATDGEEALARGLHGSYDLIVLDIMLPRRNGYRVCSDLRAAGDWTPVLMLTAKDGDLDEAEALDCGADDYLVKPFSFPVLLARVRALLRRAHGRDPVPVVVRDLRIDPAARKAWRGVNEIALTTREFDVLEFMMRRAGRLLSKTDILNGVWDADFDGDPNIVEAYVHRLRRKLDVQSELPAITTVRGAGYRFESD